MSKIEFKLIIENPELVSSTVFELAQTLPNNQQPLVAEIDPKYMGGKELCEHYELDPGEGANCVIVESIKPESTEFVAIVIPVGYRADLNGLVRKYLNAKRISLAPLEKVLEDTGMEYGSITPFGLPPSWKILIDKKLTIKEKIIIGGGKRVSKLLIAMDTLCSLPNTEVIENLSNQIS